MGGKGGDKATALCSKDVGAALRRAHASLLPRGAHCRLARHCPFPCSWGWAPWRRNCINIPGRESERRRQEWPRAGTCEPKLSVEDEMSLPGQMLTSRLGSRGGSGCSSQRRCQTVTVPRQGLPCLQSRRMWYLSPLWVYLPQAKK